MPFNSRYATNNKSPAPETPYAEKLAKLLEIRQLPPHNLEVLQGALVAAFADNPGLYAAVRGAVELELQQRQEALLEQMQRQIDDMDDKLRVLQSGA